MPPTRPTTEPTEARAGTTWSWERSFPDFPAADGWVISYAIRGAGTLDWDPAWVTTSGDTRIITIPAAKTAPLAAGGYEWVAYASLSGQVYPAASGMLQVLPNIETATPGSRQAHAERMVALIEAELERRMTGATAGGAGAIEQYTIGRRSISRYSTTELRNLLRDYRREARAARRRGSSWPPPIRTQYQRPTRWVE